MSDFLSYQIVAAATKALATAQKRVDDIGEKYRAMGLADYSIKARASASDRLTIACFERDKFKDVLHKVLVDASMCLPLAREAYDTRLLCHSHGFGHSVKFKYTPPLPKCYE
jgi:hypothetical protein